MPGCHIGVVNEKMGDKSEDTGPGPGTTLMRRQARAEQRSPVSTGKAKAISSPLRARIPEYLSDSGKNKNGHRSGVWDGDDAAEALRRGLSYPRKIDKGGNRSIF